MMKVIALLLVTACLASAQVYESLDEAKHAAERDLALLGDEVPAPAAITEKAETQAHKIAEETKAQPEHSDLTGVKVEIDQIEGVVALENTEGAKVAAPVEEAAEVIREDLNNEQAKEQSLASEVKMVHKIHRPKHIGRHLVELPLDFKPAAEVLPTAENNLLDDDGYIRRAPVGMGTRPAAPQFGSPMGGMPQLPGMEMMQQGMMGGAPQLPGMNMMGGQGGMPQLPGMNMMGGQGGMPQLPGMNMMGGQGGMPQLPGMEMMQQGMMGGAPQLPGMNMMGGQGGMPQLPGMNMMQQPQAQQQQPMLGSPELDPALMQAQQQQQQSQHMMMPMMMGMGNM